VQQCNAGNSKMHLNCDRIGEESSGSAGTRVRTVAIRS
jgi:hypothetical protein